MQIFFVFSTCTCICNHALVKDAMIICVMRTSVWGAIGDVASPTKGVVRYREELSSVINVSRYFRAATPSSPNRPATALNSP